MQGRANTRGIEFPGGSRLDQRAAKAEIQSRPLKPVTARFQRNSATQLNAREAPSFALDGSLRNTDQP